MLVVNAGGGWARWRVHVAWAVALVVAVGATGWAVRALVAPAADPSGASTAAATFVARDGQVGQTASATATVTFADGPVVQAGFGGVVTALGVDPGVPVQAGAVLASVDLRPVVAFAGVVPAFRDLAVGVSGPDVAQLRVALGLPSGSRFDAATDRAVRAWQRTLGVEATGVVALGDVVFLPSLPVRARLADQVVVGARVGAGQALVQTVVSTPSVTVPADTGGGQLTSGMAASFTVGGATYSGTLGSGVVGSDGLTRYAVVGADRASACDATCGAQFPIDGSSSVQVSVQVVATVSGVVVPVSAVGAAADGSRAVRTPEGTLITVQVLGTADGMAAVSGLTAGTTVLLFGDTS